MKDVFLRECGQDYIGTPGVRILNRETGMAESCQPWSRCFVLDVSRRMPVELQTLNLVVAGSNPVDPITGAVAQSGRARCFTHPRRRRTSSFFAVNADGTTGRRTRPSGRGPRISKEVRGARVQIPVRQRMAEKKRFINPRHCTLIPAIRHKELL